MRKIIGTGATRLEGLRCSIAKSGALLAGLGTLIATTLASSSAHAASYKVYTSSTIAASTLNANDGYCSLAEAVASVNQNSPAYNCTDFSPGSEAIITLIEAPGKSYASNHYVIGTLTINRSVRIQPSEEGFTAYVDSTGAFAFKVSSGADVIFYGLNIAHTGAASGRVLWNEGALRLSNTTVRGGNVTTEPLGIGGGIYNKGTLEVDSCTIQGNQAKKGGGLYNDSGQIPILDFSIITGNTATLAGGGIYNVWATPVSGSIPANIQGWNATISNNTAKAGGGMFNRGFIDLYASHIHHNTASGSGSGETCGSGQSCDGAGGGALIVANASNTYARVSFQGGTLVEFNTASGRGGGFYSAGQMNTSDIRIENNQANDGAAIYGAFSGTNTYCSVEGGVNTIIGNVTNPTGSGHYSIVDLTTDAPHCFFTGVTASGNSSPRCKSGSATPSCPQ